MVSVVKNKIVYGDTNLNILEVLALIIPCENLNVWLVLFIIVNVTLHIITNCA